MSPLSPFDRSRIRFRALAERRSKFRIDDIGIRGDGPPPGAGRLEPLLDRVAGAVRTARAAGAPVVLCHGAHLIKNGLGPLIARMAAAGWLTHVATNGAGAIHDWEFAFHGQSAEDVRSNVAAGEFGTWDETGRWLGLALHLAAWEGLGFGAAVGRMIAQGGLEFPEPARLEAEARGAIDTGGGLPGAAAALELLHAMRCFRIAPGRVDLPHRWAGASVQSACWSRGVPLTIHPGIGQDITYTHPAFRGAAVGPAAETDFLLFASSIERLEGGVYISAGSSVMSPMIFEKSLSMARNVLRQEGRSLERFLIVVNDLAEASWDWSAGEPPPDNPAYYVRFLKSFHRMGGELLYAGLDNRAFLHGLWARLRGG